MAPSFVTRALACSSLQRPYLDGTAITNFSAVAHTQWTPSIPLAASTIVSSLGFSTYNTTYCQVSMTYNHPGQNDTINLQVWLPETWNGRFQGTGGSGWRAGNFDTLLLPAIIAGYAAASTDAGHSVLDRGTSSWALKSPGNVDLPTFQDFGSVALNELSVFGKLITTSFYGKAPDYSYWNGCSQGGRQGMMLAQRYPKSFDGILAAAPALNWNPLFGALFTAQAVMNTLGKRPTNCEFEALTAAATKACDGLDGVLDSIISIPGLCHFDPFSVVGHSSTCKNGGTITISEAAAKVANASWYGVFNEQGAKIYPGYTYDAPLVRTAESNCYSTGNCSSAAWGLATDYYRYFVEKNATFDVSTITAEKLPSYVHASIQQFESFIGTNDPDLTGFKRAGGKLLSWHGIADDYIPSGGSTQYYDRVTAQDADVHEYYKLFLAPGVGHCAGGPGAAPTAALQQLIAWVEKGVSPDTLSAKGTQLVNGTYLARNLCPYPSVSYYSSGNASQASSYYCDKPHSS